MISCKPDTVVHILKWCMGIRKKHWFNSIALLSIMHTFKIVFSAFPGISPPYISTYIRNVNLPWLSLLMVGSAISPKNRWLQTWVKEILIFIVLTHTHVYLNVCTIIVTSLTYVCIAESLHIPASRIRHRFNWPSHVMG